MRHLHRGARHPPLFPERHASPRPQRDDEKHPLPPGPALQLVDEILVARAEAEEAEVEPVAVALDDPRSAGDAREVAEVHRPQAG